MWLSSKFIDLFTISKETVSSLREDLAATRSERDNLKFQLQVSQNQFSWLCAQVNTLQLERAELLQKVYNIHPPVPEILRAPVSDGRPQEFSFDDMGDELARKYGFPVYDEKS